MWVGFVSKKCLAFPPLWLLLNERLVRAAGGGEMRSLSWSCTSSASGTELRVLLPRMKAPQSQPRSRGSASLAVLLSSKVWGRLIKERTFGAGSGAAASNSRLHYLSLHSAPFNLFFNGSSSKPTATQLTVQIFTPRPGNFWIYFEYFIWPMIKSQLSWESEIRTFKITSLAERIIVISIRNSLNNRRGHRTSCISSIYTATAAYT